MRQKEHKESKEGEAQLSVKEVIKIFAEKRKAERGPGSDPEERLEGALARVPKSVRERILGKIGGEVELLVEQGVVSKKKKKEYEALRGGQEADIFENAYLDKRFITGDEREIRVPKDEYAKAEMLDELDKIFTDEPSESDFKKIARLSFDANGLKAANDLSGSHEKGTEFLRRIAEVFTAEDGPTRKWLKEQGVTEILATTGGGDEYGLLIKSGKELTKEIVGEAVARFEQEVASLKMDDIVDFNNDEVLMRFAGITEAAAAHMGEAELAAKLAEARSQIPEGAGFRATVSGGGATLLEGIDRALKVDGDRRLSDGDTFEKALQKMMGGTWDEADADALEAKNVFKAGLRESEDPVRRFESKVIVRTAEAREMEALLEAQKLELARKNAALRELQEMVEAMKTGGISPEDLLETLSAKLADAAK